MIRGVRYLYNQNRSYIYQHFPFMLLINFSAAVTRSETFSPRKTERESSLNLFVAPLISKNVDVLQASNIIIKQTWPRRSSNLSSCEKLVSTLRWKELVTRDSITKRERAKSYCSYKFYAFLGSNRDLSLGYQICFEFSFWIFLQYSWNSVTTSCRLNEYLWSSRLSIVPFGLGK